MLHLLSLIKFIFPSMDVGNPWVDDVVDFFLNGWGFATYLVKYIHAKRYIRHMKFAIGDNLMVYLSEDAYEIKIKLI